MIKAELIVLGEFPDDPSDDAYDAFLKMNRNMTDLTEAVNNFVAVTEIKLTELVDADLNKYKESTTKEITDRIGVAEKSVTTKLTSVDTKMAAVETRVAAIEKTATTNFTSYNSRVTAIETSNKATVDGLVVTSNNKISDIQTQFDAFVVDTDIRLATALSGKIAASADKLTNAVNIAGVSFDGSQNIELNVFNRTFDGFVPKAEGSTTTKFLREDGTWVIPTNTTYSTMSADELSTGTLTTARTVTAKLLGDAQKTLSAKHAVLLGGNTFTGTQKMDVTQYPDGTYINGLVNNLTAGGATKALTAEMGKLLVTEWHTAGGSGGVRVMRFRLADGTYFKIQTFAVTLSVSEGKSFSRSNFVIPEAFRDYPVSVGVVSLGYPSGSWITNYTVESLTQTSGTVIAVSEVPSGSALGTVYVTLMGI